MSLETSIVIPTLDDAATLGPTVERLNRVIATIGTAAEVLIVDAGSQDGTVSAAGELADRYPLLHIRVLVQDRAGAGFGSLVRLGTAYSQGRFCVLVMPDARDPLDLIPKMVTELRRGAHLVLCSRYEGAVAGHNVPWRFRAYQNAYRRAVKLLLRVDIPDSTYGFRAFNRTFVQALGLSGRRMSVCSEITFKVLLAGGVTKRVAGAQAGPMLREQSKFRLGNELGGYALTLARARLHQLGVSWF
jgi:glycosyltransferase involved in cell wall biosynthesis